MTASGTRAAAKDGKVVHVLRLLPCPRGELEEWERLMSECVREWHERQRRMEEERKESKRRMEEERRRMMEEERKESKRRMEEERRRREACCSMM